MSKRCLYIETQSEIKRYVLGKDVKPLVVVRHRLYRCDDELMNKSKVGGDEFALYRVDSTQPKGVGIPIDTNITMAYIRIARSSKSKGSVSILNSLNQISGQHIMWIIIGCVVLFSVLFGGGVK